MKRILCVWLPEFPVQRLQREQPEFRTAACVLYRQSGNRNQVVMVSRSARQDGIRPGMSLAEAQALQAAACCIEHDHESDVLELQRLAECCQCVSPTVALEQRGSISCLLLDISGCDHLFGGEQNLVVRLTTVLSLQGYFVLVAAANTVGAAWAIACWGHRIVCDRRLSSLPVESLRISPQQIESLHELGLKWIRQLTSLPRESLPSRFGSELIERLDQLFGRREELLNPIARRQPVCAEWVTDEPICNPEAVLYVCDELLREVMEVLKVRAARCSESGHFFQQRMY